MFLLRREEIWPVNYKRDKGRSDDHVPSTHPSHYDAAGKHVKIDGKVLAQSNRLAIVSRA